MNDIVISTELTPYTLSRSDANSRGDLYIEIKNRSNQAKLLSIEIHSGSGLSLTKGGFVRNAAKELGVVGAGSSTSFYTSVYPYFQGAGLEQLDIIVKEHLRDYKHTVRTYRKTIQIRVI